MTLLHTAIHKVVEHLSGANGLTLLLFWLVAIGAAVGTYSASCPDRRSLGGLLRHALPPGTFRHPSARADILFWLSRRITYPFLMAPVSLLTAGTVGMAIHVLLARWFGAGEPGQAGPVALGLFTVTMLLAYDLSYYIYHYMQHKVPLLWELHKVHHSAEVMVGATKDRIHPLDDMMNHLWDGVIPGVVYGVWLFFTRDPVEVTFFGINIYVLRNIIMMDFVRHTHLKLSFGRWLNAVVLCPHWHQLHHSLNPRHYDKNFGLMLSVWDRLFGTLVIPEPGESFVFGLAQNEHAEYHSLVRLYLLPLKKIGRMLWRPGARPLGQTDVAPAPDPEQKASAWDIDTRSSLARRA